MQDDRQTFKSWPPELIACLSAQAAPAPSGAQRLAMLTRLMAQVQALQRPPGSATLLAEEGVWLNFDGLIAFKILHADAEQTFQTALWRLKPGACFPPHPHACDEECLVLEGAISVGGHALKAGDFHLMRAGHPHPSIYSEHGALLLRAEPLAAPGRQAKRI